MSSAASRLRVARGSLGIALLLGACGGGAPAAVDLGVGGADSGGDAATDPIYPDNLPYAKSVESFTPGVGSGYGESDLPAVVLGPPRPRGSGTGAGSLHVLSLGAGGEIVIGFGDKLIEDEPGPDFIVFENAFWPGGDDSMPYAELGEVSVSEDGETWNSFPCDPAGAGAGRFPGCAGWSPTLVYDPAAIAPLQASVTGGDAFDLADLGVSRARFVKIRDLGTLEGSGPSAGFDLDSVGVVSAK